MWQAWVNFALGLWSILSGIVSTLGVSVKYIIVGIAVAVFGFWTYSRWQGIVLGILGLWMILSGLVTPLTAQWNLLLTGIVIAGLAIWQALAKPAQ